MALAPLPASPGQAERAGLPSGVSGSGLGPEVDERKEVAIEQSDSQLGAAVAGVA